MGPVYSIYNDFEHYNMLMRFDRYFRAYIIGIIYIKMN